MGPSLYALVASLRSWAVIVVTGPEDTTRSERAPDPHHVEHELDPRDVAGAYDVLETGDLEIAEPALHSHVWNDYAYSFLVDYLRRNREMTSDALWPAGLQAPREPRALGPVILRCAKAGLMERTGAYRPSVRSHLTPRIVWRSLIYREDVDA